MLAGVLWIRIQSEFGISNFGLAFIFQIRIWINTLSKNREKDSDGETKINRPSKLRTYSYGNFSFLYRFLKISLKKNCFCFPIAQMKALKTALIFYLQLFIILWDNGIPSKSHRNLVKPCTLEPQQDRPPALTIPGAGILPAIHSITALLSGPKSPPYQRNRRETVSWSFCPKRCGGGHMATSSSR